MRDVDCLVGHVLVETYSVLTRLPSPHRVAPQDAGSVLRSLSFEVLTLPSSQHQPLLGLLAGRGIRGGAVYDGLVAATARHHGCTLLTRDRRARSTYDAVGATYTLG